MKHETNVAFSTVATSMLNNHRVVAQVHGLAQGDCVLIIGLGTHFLM